MWAHQVILYSQGECAWPTRRLHSKSELADPKWWLAQPESGNGRLL